MSRRHQRALLGLVGTVVAAAAAFLVVPVPAIAAPIANADSYAVYSGGTYTLTPIANDGKTFLSFGDLSLCGVTSSDPNVVYLEQVDNTIVAEVRRGIRGETKISYEVCQGNDRATGVITLTITKITDLKGAKKAGVRGRVVFTNNSTVPVRVTYGSASSGKPDATRDVAAGKTLTIATTRKSIYWTGQYVDGESTILVGDATIKNVQSKK